MGPELDDFLRFCQVERRLAPETCRAYERDVSACLTPECPSRHVVCVCPVLRRGKSSHMAVAREES